MTPTPDNTAEAILRRNLHVDDLGFVFEPLEKFILCMEEYRSIGERAKEEEIAKLKKQIKDMKLISNIFGDRELKEKEERPDRKLLKKLCTDFFYYWYNAPGKNTEQGFDEWFEKIGKDILGSEVSTQKDTDSQP